MANFKSTEMRFLDSIFEMSEGYVLDFSTPTMDRFFMEELEIDISHEMFSKDGTSKARRVRCLLQNADHPTVVRVLVALWKHRQTIRAENKATEDVVNAEGAFYPSSNLSDRQGSTPRWYKILSLRQRSSIRAQSSML